MQPLEHLTDFENTNQMIKLSAYRTKESPPFKSMYFITIKIIFIIENLKITKQMKKTIICTYTTQRQAVLYYYKLSCFLIYWRIWFFKWLHWIILIYYFVNCVFYKIWWKLYVITSLYGIFNNVTFKNNCM